MNGMTNFVENERKYLVAQELSRLATIGPSGAPQNHPISFHLNEDTETIDIGGPNFADSQKYRNIQRDPWVSLVVDDNAPHAVGPGGQRGWGIEIRDTAETMVTDRALIDGFSEDMIGIRPHRIISWNVDNPGANNRDVELA